MASKQGRKRNKDHNSSQEKNKKSRTDASSTEDDPNIRDPTVDEVFDEEHLPTEQQVARWTLEQVASWAKACRLDDDDIAAIRTQKISGEALLILTRNDKLKDLLRIGPATILSARISRTSTGDQREASTKEIYDDLETIPSASTFASNSNPNSWTHRTKATARLKVHRPEIGTPVTLLDPVLSALYDDVVNKKYIPSGEDCAAAATLMHKLSSGYRHEVDMQADFDQWARRFGWTLVRHGHADANWITSNGCLVLNIEAKNEKGSGGSSYMQNIAYYSRFWGDKSRRDIARKSKCPCILIDITGPEISVNGAVITPEEVLCDPFITASMLWNPHDYDQQVSVARIIGAVTKAARHLISHYEKFEVPCDRFPWFRSFTSKQTQHDLMYKAIIKDLVFQAEMTTASTDTVKQVVIKFARTYNDRAHQICAEAGCAPELIYVGQVNDFRFIVMEYIEKAVHWEKASTDKKETAMGVIRTAIGRLHAAGLVHGDLRSANILISGMRVAIIDFDWAGPTTQAYPCFMNEKIKWPNGVADGKLMACAHDNDWIARSFV